MSAMSESDGASSSSPEMHDLDFVPALIQLTEDDIVPVGKVEPLSYDSFDGYSQFGPLGRIEPLPGVDYTSPVYSDDSGTPMWGVAASHDSYAPPSAILDAYISSVPG